MTEASGSTGFAVWSGNLCTPPGTWLPGYSHSRQQRRAADVETASRFRKAVDIAEGVFGDRRTQAVTALLSLHVPPVSRA